MVSTRRTVLRLYVDYEGVGQEGWGEWVDVEGLIISAISKDDHKEGVMLMLAEKFTNKVDKIGRLNTHF